MTSSFDKTKSYIPRAGLAIDGWSNDAEATATCYCGAVQLSFPTQGPGLVGTVICHCTDCHKITASMYSSIFTIQDTHLKHVRGKDALRVFKHSETIASHGSMANHFCGTCGTLMYRVGSRFPGVSLLRIGTVDDFHLHETKLKPQVEQFVEDRVAWARPCEGVRQCEGPAS
ncbi:hypothetical protein HKX48_000457 [Thoreauomyces humboldtii]|nr:hypothetical protein HKX48_000457 [Thoreauomyces humboldtii]